MKRSREICGFRAMMPGAMTEQLEQYQLKFRQRSWLPEERLDLAAIRSAGTSSAARVHFVLQFKRLPNGPARAAISAAIGLSFGSYVGGNSYLVSLEASRLEELLGFELFRAAFPLEAELKIAPRLRSLQVPPYARRPDGRLILGVRFHDDVDAHEASAVAQRLGGEVLSQVSMINLVIAAFPAEAVDRVAAEDGVQYVEFVDPPLGPKGGDAPRPTKG